jgi:signal transduction histidine kinase
VAIRLRDDFLSIASHELNTPIAALSMISQGFEQSDAIPSLAEFNQVMSLISRQSKRLATLVSNLLDATQISAGRLVLRLERVELAPLVHETVDLFRMELDRARCRVACNADPGLFGRWDRARLQQVLGNLLSNAIKFGPGKEIEVTVAGVGNGIARIVVEDHGMGIPPEHVPHIFDRFERAVSAAHYGGLGLGLYIVRTLVNAHGGTVAVTSEVGHGARFVVDLPVGDWSEEFGGREGRI